MIKFGVFSFKEAILDSLGKKRTVTTVLHDQKSHWDFINSPAPVLLVIEKFNNNELLKNLIIYLDKMEIAQEQKMVQKKV